MQHDGSARSHTAYDLRCSGRGGAEAGVASGRPDDPPGPRNALVVVSGWGARPAGLAAGHGAPLARQPIRSTAPARRRGCSPRGSWTRPSERSSRWTSTSAIEPALEFSQTLARYLLGDRLGIAEVILLSLAVRAHVLRRHQAGVVAKRL